MCKRFSEMVYRFSEMSNRFNKLSKPTCAVNFGHVKIKMKAKYLKIENSMDTIIVRNTNDTTELVHHERICYCNDDYVETRYPFTGNTNGNNDAIDIEVELKPDIKYILNSVAKGELIQDAFDAIISVNGERKVLGLNVNDISTQFKVYVQGMESDSLEVTKYIYRLD